MVPPPPSSSSVAEPNRDSHLLPPTPNLVICNSFADIIRIFSDVPGDITIIVAGYSFLLHKFPLASQSGRIRKMLPDLHGASVSKLELPDLPGGPQTFELVAKFCYGTNFEITTANVAHLRCAAEYLEMNADNYEENLITRTDTYLNEIVAQSLEKSVEVLCACEKLPPLAEEIGIPDTCIDAIARVACEEQLVSPLDCDGTASLEPRDRCLEWWVEDLSVLRIDFYGRVVTAMGKNGVRTDSITASLMHYAQLFLKNIEKTLIWNPARTNCPSPQSGQKIIVETLVSILPSEKSSSVPLNFLFGMLRAAMMADATLACRLELERRIASRLEMVLLDDLLIPSVQPGDYLFDIDTVYRILVHFLQRIEEEENEEDCIATSVHDSLLNVGRLVDAYLAEIAPDPYLSLKKFMSIIEILPDYARIIDDGLYRAVDIYLKAHPLLTDKERKKLCKLIDCEKLSEEACNHAAQNDRVAVLMVVRVLYLEQLRLKNALSERCGDWSTWRRMSRGVGVGGAAVSPGAGDTYAYLRRENQELKVEISRMRARMSELKKEQVFMKQGMVEKSTRQGKTSLLNSISRGIGRIHVFSGGPPAAGGGRRHTAVGASHRIWNWDRKITKF